MGRKIRNSFFENVKLEVSISKRVRGNGYRRLQFKKEITIEK